MMNKMNGKEKNNCHYRDCEAITDNLSRIKNKKRNVIARSAQVRTSKRSVMPILPAGKIQGIFELNKISGRSLEKIFKKIFRDDLSFLFAEILGSKLSFCPRMTEKWRCLRMTFSTLILAAILSFGIISDSRAGCEGCEGECQNLGCGYKCTACKEGYELYNTCWFQSCRKSCDSNQERISWYCVPKNQTCNGGNVCKDDSGNIKSNCCFKTEGDTTIMYADNNNYYYDAKDVSNLPENKNLIIKEGAIKPSNKTIYNADTIYFDGLPVDPSGELILCDNLLPSLKHMVFINTVSGISYGGCGNKPSWDVSCIGPSVDSCRSFYGSYGSKVVAPTESLCNGSGTYYYNGSECIKRPEDPDDMVCRGGYAKLNNNCVDPLKTFAKKRYTPAEAAQWLKDDDNEITITFKK